MSDDDSGSASGGSAEPEPPSPISVEADGEFDIDLPRLRAHLRRAAGELGRPVRRLAIEVIDDARMTALHQRHLGLDHSTDVLTFPADGGDGDEIDVDIAVCVDEARRQAARRGHALEDELLLYAVHGLLHCAGHDDHDEAAALAMHEEEDRILLAIGVGPVFARGEGESR